MDPVIGSTNETSSRRKGSIRATNETPSPRNGSISSTTLLDHGTGLFISLAAVSSLETASTLEVTSSVIGLPVVAEHTSDGSLEVTSELISSTTEVPHATEGPLCLGAGLISSEAGSIWSAHELQKARRQVLSYRIRVHERSITRSEPCVTRPLAEPAIALQNHGVRSPSRSLAVIAVAAPVSAIGFWLLSDSPRDPKTSSASVTPSSVVHKTELTAPTASRPDDGEFARKLEARLARAIDLAHDFEPLSANILRDIAAGATVAKLPGIATRARSELELYEKATRARDIAMATRARDEARALARNLEPAAISRFAEAIALASAIGDAASARSLAGELEMLRTDMRSREAIVRVDRDRAGKRDDGTTDEDPKLRDGFERLARGERAALDPVLTALVKRAGAEHDAGSPGLAVRDYLLARHALELANVPFNAGSELGRVELQSRLEEAGRLARRSDGPAALALLEMSELRTLDESAPRSAKVHYLLGRALEADGRPDEAKKDYESAMGTVTWLGTSVSIELLRYFARCRVLREPITIESPGAGPTWRRIPRPSCVVFVEAGDEGLGMGGRVERARDKAIHKLGLGEPIRQQAFPPVVFVYSSRERYRRGAAPSLWAGGHSTWNELEDGLASEMVVYLTPELDDTLAHEWTHVIVNDAMKGERLPSWAIEGVASWVEEGETRKWRLSLAAAERERLPSWHSFLTTRLDPRYVGADSRGAAQFYAQSLLAFETAVKRTGSAGKVLAAATKIAAEKGDPFAALGFEDEEDFSKAAGVVVPRKK
jgi:hypothetical protein